MHLERVAAQESDSWLHMQPTAFASESVVAVEMLWTHCGNAVDFGSICVCALATLKHAPHKVRSQ
eukprot:scaffold301017_cov24-Tisochrysis_lutea.AAC.2